MQLDWCVVVRHRDDLVDCRRTGAQRVHDLSLPLAPVLDVVIDHFRGVVEGAKVAGKDTARAELAHSRQAVEVVVHVAFRWCDHRRSLAEHVVACKQTRRVVLEEAQVIARVTRGVKRQQARAIDLDDGSIL
jgi:hypothetical protein